MTREPAAAQSPPEVPYPAARPAVARLTTRLFGARKGPPGGKGGAKPAGRAAPPELTDAWFDDLISQLDEASARLAAAAKRLA